ncbi:hypothetical protein MBLNU13_g00679t2 [Cladosporium sp. NU13]
MKASMFIKKTQGTKSLCRSDSPILSDFTILLPCKKEKRRKKTDGEPEDDREKMFAHKLILASGSSAFEKYFQQTDADSGKESTNTASELEIEPVYESVSPQCYKPVLRCLHGLSLDEDVKSMQISAVKGTVRCSWRVWNSRPAQISSPRAGRKDWGASWTACSAPPGPVRRSRPIANLDPFVFDVEDLLNAGDPDEELEISEMMRVAIKTCCKYFAVIRQWERFQALACKHPKLHTQMLYYAAAKGDDLLGTDPRTGQHVIDSPSYDEVD